MLTIPDDQLRQWLAEDVPYGDLTTYALGFGNRHGRIRFEARQAMVAACSEEGGRIMALAVLFFRRLSHHRQGRWPERQIEFLSATPEQPSPSNGGTAAQIPMGMRILAIVLR